MKTQRVISYISIFIFAVVLLVSSCVKKDVENDSQNKIVSNETIGNTIDEQLTFYYNSYRSKHRNIFDRVWKWIKAHTGSSLFDNCQGNYGCGPCVGICLGSGNQRAEDNIFEPMDGSGLLPEEDYNDGIRAFQIALFNDSIMGVSLTQDNFSDDGFLHIPKNFNIGTTASALFEKDSIIIKEGVYEISYSHGKNGSTLVDVLSY